ncbi:MAG: DNA-directed polymerase [Firmicutes bacterium]|nr:DNA-directed polymerase [Bacillota bacterium]
MDTLAIDLETYSPLDIKKVGAYAYANHSDFEILLFAYAWNDDPVQIIDLVQGEQLPMEVIKAIHDDQILKTAYNAAFERICLSKYFKTNGFLPADGWACTSVLALTLGLPGTLEQVGNVMRLASDKKKLATGKALIRYFCTPCKPTKTNGGRTRNLPEHAPDKWEQFKEYCRQDVEAERAIRKKLERFQPVPEERRLWLLDQQINDRGVRVDTALVNRAITCDEQHKGRTLAEAIKLTGLDNPNSGVQLKEWLFDEECLVVESLTKETVPELLKQTDSETVKRVLELCQELSKTSVKKYAAMQNALCNDGRVRGLLQFYGANRTGRWAGRLVQVQNLPQNHLPDLDLARQLLHEGNYELIELLFGNVQSVLSQLIRTAFVPKEGYRFIVADFSAIEARVIAWLAGEKWRLDVFNTHGKIYEASAAAMFKVPIESIDKHSPLRQKGKVAELALGYQGGPKAMEKMGALKQGLTEEELPGIVSAWRTANPAITKLWHDTEDAATKAVKDKTKVALRHGVHFSYESGMLFAHLPSGRRLAYVRPRLAIGKFDREALSYEGMDQTTKQWRRLDTYGGKLVENLVQAIARDCLRDAMIRLDYAGYKTVMHVHDEVIIEAPEGWGSLENACDIMGQTIPWAPGLPLRADGFECGYYKKDD